MNLEKLQKVIEAIGSRIEPEADWMPALILEGEGKANAIFGFVGDCLKNDEAKDATAEAMKQVIADLKPHTACFITTAWSVEFDKDEEMRVRPSQHPKRIEIVNAYCYGDKGENEGETLMFGYIQRFKDKSPKIKKWKVWDDDDTTAKGRFPEAIQDGFKLARGG